MTDCPNAEMRDRLPDLLHERLETSVRAAVMAHVEPLLKAGARIYRADGPFEHSKLFTIDDDWALIGSANWDIRSMRLNFEITMEVYDPGFAAAIGRQIDQRKDGLLTLDQLVRRPWLLRLRDQAARLMLPYL